MSEKRSSESAMCGVGGAQSSNPKKTGAYSAGARSAAKLTVLYNERLAVSVQYVHRRGTPRLVRFDSHIFKE